MAFYEDAQFPPEIAAWLTGGRGFRTPIVETYGGDEFPNMAWDQARGEWNVDQALRCIGNNSAYAMLNLYRHFLSMHGMFHGFRVRAPFDNADDGCGILGVTGVGVASTLVYQMYKNITTGATAKYQQIVNKPTSAILIYKNNVLQTLTTNYSLNTVTGQVTFVSQPTIGQTLTWVGPYDIAVRYGGDMPNIGREPTGSLATWQGLKLIERKNP